MSGGCDACDGHSRVLLPRGVFWVCPGCVDSPEEKAINAEWKRMGQAAKANGGKLL